MNLSFYQLIISHLSEAPDLSIVQTRHPVPEQWPLVLEGMQISKKQVQSFSVTDGKTSVYCVAPVPEIYDKAAHLERGAIIHLLGSSPKFDNHRKIYILEVQSICTLKEFDDRIKQEREEEALRRAKIQDEGFFEMYSSKRGGEP